MPPWWVQALAVLGAMGTAGVATVKALKEYTPEAHDVRTCKCQVCSHKRLKAEVKHEADVARMKAQGGATRQPTPPQDASFMSTTHLEQFDLVAINGNSYRVNEIRIDKDGYVISLTNLRTRNAVVSKVAFTIADRKIWQPIGRRGV